MAKAKGAKYVIGVDPASKNNGWAVLNLVDELWDVGEFCEIGRLYQCPIEQFIPMRGALALIECPSWGGYGTKVVRSAAVQWERFLKGLGLGIRVLRVDPRTWQGVILGPKDDRDTKERAILKASEYLRYAVESDHIADAVCLAEYGRLIATGVIEEPVKNTQSRCKKAS